MAAVAATRDDVALLAQMTATLLAGILSSPHAAKLDWELAHVTCMTAARRILDDAVECQDSRRSTSG